MAQLSMFSAESDDPEISDLTGLLAAPGQVTLYGADAAVISVVVNHNWRAEAIAQMLTELELKPTVTVTDEGNPLVRSQPDARLRELAKLWTKGAMKYAPAEWIPSPRALRMWVLASGEVDGVDRSKYLLGLDVHAPDTHPHLATSVMRAGIAPTLVGTRGGRPGLRIAGHRRLVRLSETVGQPPRISEQTTQHATASWPLWS